MARNITAICRLCRRTGNKLTLKGTRCITKCTLDKRESPPGPQLSRRRRLSERGIQLREKQKARFLYGMMEGQFRRLFEQAERQPGITGDNLVVLLERRLDNVVYRLGYADSRAQARQLVRHGHIFLNGRRTNVPSALVKESDTISWRPESAKTEYYKQLQQTIESRSIVNWLSIDKQSMVGRVVSLPTPEDLDAKIDGKAIVEYYSR